MYAERIQKIRDSIPKKFFFDESFEKNGFAQKILSDVPMSFDGVKHGNFLNCSPILKKDQEYHLFRKLNYLRYRLIKLTCGFSQSDQAPAPKPCEAQNLERLKESGIKNIECIVEKMNDTRNIILKANTRMAVKYVQWHETYDSFEYEEMMSNAYCHIIKAIDNFDFRRGFKFSTYCVNVLKSNLGRDKAYSIRTRAALDGAELLQDVQSKFDVDFSDINQKYNNELIDQFFDYVRKTATKPEDKIEVIKGCFGLGGNFKLLRELGDKMGVSKERIRQIKNETLRIMRKCDLVHDPLC